MKKRIGSILLCMTLVLCLSSCGKNAQAPVETDEEPMREQSRETKADAQAEESAVPTEPEEIDGQEVLSEDGKYRVVVPKGWENSEDRQEESMCIELQGPTDDQYAGIMVIDKAAVGTMDIAAYMDSYAEGARQQMENANIGEKTEVDVNGNKAYYLVINGKVENVSYINWVYAIDGGGSIYVATGTAYPANTTDAETAFREIVYSFEPVEELPEEEQSLQ